MLLRRIFDDRLAQVSYLVACEHARVGLIVDPNRNLSAYIDAAAAENIRIVAVTETHIHADFVSGARELADATDAQLLLSDEGGTDWQYAFAADAGASMLSDGSTFMVGDIRVEAIHTPGHTPEHLSFLLTDTASAQAPMGALTGDFIFVGDVGRPDLLERAAGHAGTMEAGARQLFKSLQQFKTRPDYLQLWPGHGAGSACGKALGAMPQTTLGYEKLFNWGLAELDEQRFVDAVLSGQPEPPAYFALMKQINRDGRPVTVTQTPRILTASDVAAAIQNGSVVVDTRPTAAFTAGHATGTISLPRTKSFLTYCGAILPYHSPVIFIAAGEEQARRELASDLSLIGLDSIGGVMPVEEVPELATVLGTECVSALSVADVAHHREITVLDVRGRSEFANGHLAHAINIPFGEIQSRIDEIPRGDVVVHCQGGTRSIIAASILQREGRNGISNMLGGFAEWERGGHPVERGKGSAGD